MPTTPKRRGAHAGHLAWPLNFATLDHAQGVMQSRDVARVPTRPLRGTFVEVLATLELILEYTLEGALHARRTRLEH